MIFLVSLIGALIYYFCVRQCIKWIGYPDGFVFFWICLVALFPYINVALGIVAFIICFFIQADLNRNIKKLCQKIFMLEDK
jgi:low affinity Fe/Cu permease